jgi:hypothetical protein
VVDFTGVRIEARCGPIGANVKVWWVLGIAVTAGAALVWVLTAYVRDIGAARRRISSGSEIADTKCGPIEYAIRGRGPPVSSSTGRPADSIKA